MVRCFFIFIAFFAQFAPPKKTRLFPPHALLAGGGDSYDYDVVGNMVSRTRAGVTDAFGYSIDNRLEAVTRAGAEVGSYGYDPYGRRLLKTVKGVTTYYLYADNGLVAEFSEDGTELKSYGYRPGAAWGSDPLFMMENNQRYWYINDHLGTPQKLLDQSGAVVWSALYDAYGRATVEVEAVESNLRFPGQYYDEETGLHYNWHRYYDPATGRYMTPDPIGLEGGINLYLYSEADPVNKIDPLGLDTYDDVYDGIVDGSGPLTGPYTPLTDNGTYAGGEGHFILGGGAFTITCCDGNVVRKLTYVKVCLGVAFGGSGSGGVAFDANGPSCKNPPVNMLGVEAGFSTPIPGLGLEGGGAVGTNNEGISTSLGGGPSGGIWGLSGKLTPCYYRLVRNKSTGQCCSLE
ncbi:MAG: hypothetical protein C0613_05510 [Desulfobulbaceae bacterium]|nr:MAG: hypothetical protein C0613_05510 [Desulfobulbaceae bacterium]